MAVVTLITFDDLQTHSALVNALGRHRHARKRVGFNSYLFKPPIII